jgi:hypothetical protein
MLGLQARALGERARPNLAISKPDLNMGRELACGAQSSVMEGSYQGKPGGGYTLLLTFYVEPCT